MTKSQRPTSLVQGEAQARLEGRIVRRTSPLGQDVQDAKRLHGSARRVPQDPRRQQPEGDASCAIQQAALVRRMDRSKTPEIRSQPSLREQLRRVKQISQSLHLRTYLFARKPILTLNPRRNRAHPLHESRRFPSRSTIVQQTCTIAPPRRTAAGASPSPLVETVYCIPALPPCALMTTTSWATISPVRAWRARLKFR